MDWFLYDNGLRHERVKNSVNDNFGNNIQLQEKSNEKYL